MQETEVRPDQRPDLKKSVLFFNMPHVTQLSITSFLADLPSDYQLSPRTKTPRTPNELGWRRKSLAFSPSSAVDSPTTPRKSQLLRWKDEEENLGSDEKLRDDFGLLTSKRERGILGTDRDPESLRLWKPRRMGAVRERTLLWTLVAVCAVAMLMLTFLIVLTSGGSHTRHMVGRSVAAVQNGESASPTVSNTISQ